MSIISNDWKYVTRFGTFHPFVSRVKCVSPRGIFSLPINQFFGKNLDSKEAAVFLTSLGDQAMTEPKNFEEYALKFVGRELYETFFYGYTKKAMGMRAFGSPSSHPNA